MDCHEVIVGASRKCISEKCKLSPLEKLARKSTSRDDRYVHGCKRQSFQHNHQHEAKMLRFVERETVGSASAQSR